MCYEGHGQGILKLRVRKLGLVSIIKTGSPKEAMINCYLKNELELTRQTGEGRKHSMQKQQHVQKIYGTANIRN